MLAINSRAEKRDELQFRRGELLFGLKQFKLAELAYTQAITVGPKSRYFEKAMTKRGWALFKQEKFQHALRAFFELADRKLKPLVGLVTVRKLSRGDKELIDDVLRVAVLSFNELGGSAAINIFFENFGRRDYEIRVYEELAEFYVKQKRVRDAAVTYHAFSKTFPMHEQAYEFDIKAINTYTSAGFASVLMEEKQAFVRRYRVNGAYWKEYEEQEDTILAGLKKALSKNSEDVVRHMHAQAQKTKTSENYQRAYIL